MVRRACLCQVPFVAGVGYEEVNLRRFAAGNVTYRGRVVAAF